MSIYLTILNARFDTSIVLFVVAIALLIAYLALNFQAKDDKEKQKAKNVGITCAVFTGLAVLVFLSWHFQIPK